MTGPQVSMTQVDRMYEDNLARKKRSMVAVSEFNKIYGQEYHPPSSSESTRSFYENIDAVYPSSKASESSSSSASTGSSDNRKDIEKWEKLDSEAESDIELFIKVSDCFDWIASQ